MSSKTVATSAPLTKKKPSATAAKTTPKTTAKKVVKKIVVKKSAAKTAAKSIAKPKNTPAATSHKKELPNLPEEETSEDPVENPSSTVPAPEETVQNPRPRSASEVSGNAQTAVDDSSGDLHGAGDGQSGEDDDSGEDPSAEGAKKSPENEEGGGVTREEELAVSERRRKRKTEIFIGGLDRNAKEEDIRKVFEKIGEVVEVRLMMNPQTGKNKGYAFLRYASPADARRAVSEFAKVEVCGKRCAAAALEDNDTIYIGNIDKKWKKEDVIKMLLEIGVENIDLVTIMPDPNNTDHNRGFAFLELATNKDAQNAYKKLQKKGVFGKNRDIKVSWTNSLSEPDEELMQKVKSVYAEGIPYSWDEKKMRKYFEKYGEIERIVLSRNIQSARRKDFAFVNYMSRGDALACVESFNKEELFDGGSKVNVKVSLAKPAQKDKQSKVVSKPTNREYPNEKTKGVHDRDSYDTKKYASFDKGKFVNKGVSSNAGANRKSSTTQELLKVLREQASWGPGQSGSGRGRDGYLAVSCGNATLWLGNAEIVLPYSLENTINGRIIQFGSVCFVLPGLDGQDYTHALRGEKRSFAALGDDVYSDLRGYPRTRLDSSYSVGSPSYSAFSRGMDGSPLQYYQQRGAAYTAGSRYPGGAVDPSSTLQIRHGSSALYGSDPYLRY